MVGDDFLRVWVREPARAGLREEVTALLPNALEVRIDPEFAAPLAFIAMSVPLLRDRAMVGAAIAAGIVVIAAQGLPLRLGLVAAALTGIAVGLLLERKRA